MVAGPANVYAHYVATREEYGVQRYEGASTIFGPCKFCRDTSASAISWPSLPVNLGQIGADPLPHEPCGMHLPHSIRVLSLHSDLI